ncbi:hypothetical protein KP509_30G075200 [Ceratopteris richardii]|uniref:Uncharacterized protein n=1 Tax=Ceratopteris richardii TaxID=49495 RepID=A0A8T2R4Y9_CERRI|nr:hypothetical protein KP509_30G075200 [Ceratopteris richardii]
MAMAVLKLPKLLTGSQLTKPLLLRTPATFTTLMFCKIPFKGDSVHAPQLRASADRFPSYRSSNFSSHLLSTISSNRVSALSDDTNKAEYESDESVGDGGKGDDSHNGRGGRGGNGDDGFSDYSKDNDPESPFGWYLMLLGKYPVTTKAITSALLTLFGDFVCQFFIEKSEKINFTRLGIFTLLGLVLVGPTLHFWYLNLNKLIPGPGTYRAGARLALDQFLFSPIFIGVFLSALMTLEGHANDIVPKLKQDWLSAVVANWKIWIPFQFLNFLLVPQQLQRKLAIRVLSQDCSTGPTERNWSTWALFHTKKRNRLSSEQLERLVYCHCNLKLLEKKGNYTHPLQMSRIFQRYLMRKGTFIPCSLKSNRGLFDKPEAKPLGQRHVVLAANVIALAWNTYLSFAAHKDIIPPARRDSVVS